MQSLNPGDFVRLEIGNTRAHYKLVVNARGIRLRRARAFETLGAVLGAHISHKAAVGDCVKLFGLEFLIVSDGFQPALQAVEQSSAV